MFNQVSLVGHLGADPEVKTFQDGGQFANLRLATSQNWTDKQTGEKKEKVQWHTVVIKAEGLCRVAQAYLRKGARVFIQGQLEYRKYTGQDNVERWIAEVVLYGMGSTLKLLDRKQEGSGTGHGAHSANVPELDDEVPF